MSIELSPIAKAPAPPAESFAADTAGDDEDDDDEFYVDDLSEAEDDDDDDDELDEANAFDDAYDDDEYDDDDDDDDVGDDGGAHGEVRGEPAQALPGMTGFDNLRPSEQRRAIQPSVSGPADDALEPSRWEQPQFGINLAPSDDVPDAPQAGARGPDLFSERLRQAVTDDAEFEDPAFEDKATKFFEDDEPTARRRFGRRG